MIIPACGQPTKGGGRCAHPVTPGTPCAAGHAPRAGSRARTPAASGAAVASSDPFGVPSAMAAAEATKWANHGFTGQDANVWAATGATPFQADKYRAAGFGPAETAAWMTVPEGLPTFPPTGPMARRWTESPIYHDGTDPADAHAWRAAGLEDPDDAAEAFAWADRLGYADNADGGLFVAEDGPYPAEVQAAAWAQFRFTPAEQAAWSGAGFGFENGRGPASARVWRDHVTDAGRAGAWRRLIGNNPGAARRLEELGVTPDVYELGDETFAAAPADTGIFHARSSWRDVGVTDGREAQAWFHAGFDPWTAAEWKAAAAEPVDARQMVDAGRTPNQR